VSGWGEPGGSPYTANISGDHHQESVRRSKRYRATDGAAPTREGTIVATVVRERATAGEVMSFPLVREVPTWPADTVPAVSMPVSTGCHEQPAAPMRGPYDGVDRGVRHKSGKSAEAETVSFAFGRVLTVRAAATTSR
jgi:hypothetical protein